MSLYPTALKITPEEKLLITWSDDSQRLYSFRELRDHCPCATCREQRREVKAAPLLPVLSAAEAQPLKINGMKPVGNYAYSIAFSDGHDTGIYTFETLLALGEAASPG